MESAGEPISIRISDRLMAELNHAAAQMDLSLHETMRETMKIGIADMKACNWDRHSPIVAAVRALASPDNITPMPVAAEDAARYQTKKAAK